MRFRLIGKKISDDYGGFLPESQKGSLTDFLTGDKQFSIKEWSLGLVKYLLHEFIVNGKLLGMLLLLTIFFRIFFNLFKMPLSIRLLVKRLMP